jgi:ABC-type multidrug transport system permease subunit
MSFTTWKIKKLMGKLPTEKIAKSLFKLLVVLGLTSLVYIAVRAFNNLPLPEQNGVQYINESSAFYSSVSGSFDCVYSLLAMLVLAIAAGAIMQFLGFSGGD